MMLTRTHLCFVHLRAHIRLFALFIVTAALPAFAADQRGQWLNVEHLSVEELTEKASGDFHERQKPLPLTGGSFWHLLEAELQETTDLVIDFQSSSVVGEFEHYVVDSNNELIATAKGGIQSQELNVYLLRHGRDINLPAGKYRIFTHLKSPFLLAQPTPKLYEKLPYIQSIKLGNVVTLIGLGVFLSLGLYYLVLGVTRRQPTDFLYATFILANFTYNASALNFFSDVFGWPVFYTIGFPIMVSNMAYIAFVMALLGITNKRTPKLFKTGIASLTLLGSFWLIVPFVPNMSLEFARYGVGVFSLYGVTSGIIMAFRGLKTARYYLIANIAFVIPAFISIALQSLPESTMFIEHIGLFAVAMEVVLLSLVLSYQLSVVYKEKSANLVAAQEALTIADNAVQAKERFLANISHELRTPLNAIQGSVDLLSVKTTSKSAQEHVEVIRHSSSFLLFLINDILDLAKLNADMLVVERRPFNLKEMVTQICSIYGSSFTVNSQAQFKLDIVDDVPGNIVGDEKRIEQVIANLLSNAFKFTDQGTVTFRLEKTVDDKFLKFSVQDSGIGIEPENLSSMFSAFTQADSSISRKYGGTGLGLRIASKIVELMGGEIYADSIPGQGSNFWFTIPLELAPNEDLPTESQSDENLEISFPELSVLVVDDNTVNLKVINGLLNKVEAKVESFSNAKDAIQFAELNAEHIDLVIMDIQMPEIDGLSASKSLRSNGYEKPIIAFTANASEDDQIACFEAGMNDILIKPIKLQNLIEVLRKWRPKAKAIA